MKIFSSVLMLCFLSYASASCRDAIKDVICLVNAVDDSNSFGDQYSRPCLSGGEQYLRYFYAHYDRSSKLIKKMYCSLDKIWIENELDTTAYAVPVKDQTGRVVAGAIGMSRKFLDANLSLKEWFEQKENSSFGHSDVVRYSVKSQKKLTAIDYAINHEFGHLFDFANDLQKSWSLIANQDLGPIQAELCFYQCGGQYISKDKAQDLFQSLMQSTFVSSYASMSSKEDWAETFALYQAQDEKKLELQVVAGEERFDLHQHLNSEKLKEKREFYRSFIQAPIKYPSQN